MADALLSPTVGGAAWAAAAAATAGASRALTAMADDRKVPLMGVAGAFVFAAQMVNFAIPGTGSSGHMGGGLLLAILLGPHAAFLVMASVLTLQALFFADGGLLALGANALNMGAVPAFVVYPLVFRPLAGPAPSERRLTVATVVSAVAALQLGSLGVVVETTLSGIASLPPRAFLLAMQPIHLAIGLVEGLATMAVVGFVAKMRPEVFALPARSAGESRSLRPVVVALLAAALFAGGVLSLVASRKPDGLEWSVSRVSGRRFVPEAPGTIRDSLRGLAGAGLTLGVVAFSGWGLGRLSRRRKLP